MTQLIQTVTLNQEALARAYNAISWHPERRAAGDAADYLQHMKMVEEWFAPYAHTDEERAELAADLQRYHDRWLRHFYAHNNAQSRCASAAVVGFSKFPTRTNNKRVEIADRRMREWMEFQAKAQRALRSKWAPSARQLRRISSGDPEAVQKLERKLAGLESRQELMKRANKIVRANATDERKIAALRSLGLTEADALKRLHPERYSTFHHGAGYAHWELSNNNAEIRRTRERIVQVKALQARPGGEWAFAGGTITEDVGDDRFVVRHDTRIPREEFKMWKRQGWHWSPTRNGLCRQRTTNAMDSILYLTGVDVRSKPEQERENGDIGVYYIPQIHERNDEVEA